MGLFGGYVWLFCGFGGGPEGLRWGKYPSQIWMSWYDEERCGWCGYLWVHDITFMVGKHDTENASFWGVFLAALGLWWGDRGPWMEKSPLPDVDEYVEEKCCWCGYLWLHDITLIVWKHDRENGSFWGVCLAVLGLWLGPLRALDGQITPAGCGWVSYMMKNVAGVGICGCMTSL